VKVGEIITDHFCCDCLISLGQYKQGQTQKNDWCAKCLHMGLGYEGQALVGNWLELRKPPNQEGL
jgi:hypothetical protein